MLGGEDSQDYKVQPSSKAQSAGSSARIWTGNYRSHEWHVAAGCVNTAKLSSTWAPRWGVSSSLQIDRWTRGRHKCSVSTIREDGHRIKIYFSTGKLELLLMHVIGPVTSVVFRGIRFPFPFTIRDWLMTDLNRNLCAKIMSQIKRRKKGRWNFNKNNKRIVNRESWMQDVQLHTHMLNNRKHENRWYAVTCRAQLWSKPAEPQFRNSKLNESRILQLLFAMWMLCVEVYWDLTGAAVGFLSKRNIHDCLKSESSPLFSRDVQSLTTFSEHAHLNVLLLHTNRVLSHGSLLLPEITLQ